MKKTNLKIQGMELISSLTDLPVISQVSDNESQRSPRFNKVKSNHQKLEFRSKLAEPKTKNSLLLNSSIGSPISREKTIFSVSSSNKTLKGQTFFESLKKKQFRVSALMKSTDKISQPNTQQNKETSQKLSQEKPAPYQSVESSASKTHLTLIHYQTIKDHLRSGKLVPADIFTKVD
jgi:hypothetical protein